MSDTSTGTTTSSTGRTALVVLGVLLLLGGLACVGIGFAGFASSAGAADAGRGAGRDMALFACGGLAAVVGLGVVAFTRASAMMRDGRYTRITVEHGQRPADGPADPR